MIPGIDLETFLGSASLIVIAVIVFIESGFPFGFFLPGDTLLFTAGLLAARGDNNIAVVIIVILLAAIAGVTAGYFTGKKLGQKFLNSERKLFFERSYVDKATLFYEKHGGKAIVLGRFVPAVRSFVPIVAGVAGMRYRTFMFYNVIGGIIWATLVPLLGYFGGASLKSHGINVDNLILPIIAIIIVVSLLSPLLHASWKRVKKHRTPHTDKSE